MTKTTKFEGLTTHVSGCLMPRKKRKVFVALERILTWPLWRPISAWNSMRCASFCFTCRVSQSRQKREGFHSSRPENRKGPHRRNEFRGLHLDGDNIMPKTSTFLSIMTSEKAEKKTSFRKTFED